MEEPKNDHGQGFGSRKNRKTTENPDSWPDQAENTAKVSIFVHGRTETGREAGFQFIDEPRIDHLVHFATAREGKIVATGVSRLPREPRSHELTLFWFSREPRSSSNPDHWNTMYHLAASIGSP